MLMRAICRLAPALLLAGAAALGLSLTENAESAGLRTGFAPMQSFPVSLTLDPGTTWEHMVDCLKGGGEVEVNEAGMVSCAPPDSFTAPVAAPTPEPARAVAQPDSAPLVIPGREPDYNAPTTCTNFNGVLQTASGGGNVCSEIDINDTFCIVGSKDAFPCRGLFEHVRKCNGYNRPALDPFHCAGVCGEKHACGAGCAKGGIRPVGRIPYVAANYNGEVFRVTATMSLGEAYFQLTGVGSAITVAAVDGTVAVVGFSTPTPETRRHPAILRTGFSCGGTAKLFGVTDFAFILTVQHFRPLPSFYVSNAFSGKFGNLPSGEIPNLRFAKIGGADILAVSHAGDLHTRNAVFFGSGYEMTIKATSPDLLGEFRFTVRVSVWHRALRPRPQISLSGVYDAGDILTTLSVDELGDETYAQIRGSYDFGVSPDGKVTVARWLPLNLTQTIVVGATSPTLNGIVLFTIAVRSECVRPANWARIREQLGAEQQQQLDAELLDTAGLSSAQDCRNLQRGANPLAVRDYGSTPLYLAVGRGDDTRIIPILISWGADVNEDSAILGRTPLMNAAIHDNLFMGLALLLRGARVNKADRVGQNAAHYLTKKHRKKKPQNQQFAGLLIGAGINLDAQDRDGRSVVYLAAEYNNHEVARRFLERGANPNLLGGLHKLGAMHLAQTEDMAELLWRHGGDVNLKSKGSPNGHPPRDSTPLDVNENPIVGSFLRSKGGGCWTSPINEAGYWEPERCWTPWIYPPVGPQSAENGEN